jgi:hypothetical protein
LKFIEHIDFAAKTAGLHGKKYIAAELKRFAKDFTAGYRQAAIIASAQFADAKLLGIQTSAGVAPSRSRIARSCRARRRRPPAREARRA